METKRCKACGEGFVPWPQSKSQQYCSKPACQRERRRRKQAEKRASSAEARASDAQYFKDWAAKHPDYWKNYRALHPDYVERNRAQQRRRNDARHAPVTPSGEPVLPSGLFRLIPATPDMIANEDAWIVEIIVLSAPADITRANCK